MGSKRVFYLDALRIFATFMVVMLHVAAYQWWDVYNQFPVQWNVLNIYNGSVRFAVPVFVMISGTLFLNPEKKITVKALYSKNILHLVIIFIFWSLFYAGWEAFRGRDDAAAFVGDLVKGHFHMWYIYMMLGIYIFIPVLRRIAQETELLHYFLIVAFVVTFLIPGIAKLNIFPEGMQNVFSDVGSKMMIYMPLGYIPYFMAGYYLNSKEIGKKEEVLIYILGIIGFIMTSVLTYYETVRLNKPSEIFYRYDNLNILFESISVFVLFKNRVSKLKAGKTTPQWIAVLSKDTLGIYMVHEFVLSIITGIGLTTISFNPIIAVPTITLITFVISGLISAIFHHIPLIKHIAV